MTARHRVATGSIFDIANPVHSCDTGIVFGKIFEK